MTQPKRTLEEQLINYKISRERYDKEATRLLAAGFTQQQAEKIIIRKTSKNTVESVLNNHDTLLAEPYKLNHEQIVAIAANIGGAQAMKTVIASFPQLRALGFNEVQIVAIAANIGGAQAIKAVQKCHSELISHGYSLERITKLAACTGGAKQIQKNYEKECANYLNAIEQLLLFADIPPNQGIINLAHEFLNDSVDDNGTSSPPQAIGNADRMDCEEGNVRLFDEDFDVHEKPLLVPDSEPLKTYGLFATSSRHKRVLNHIQEEESAPEPNRKRHK